MTDREEVVAYGPQATVLTAGFADRQRLVLVPLGNKRRLAFATKWYHWSSLTGSPWRARQR